MGFTVAGGGSDSGSGVRAEDMAWYLRESLLRARQAMLRRTQFEKSQGKCHGLCRKTYIGEKIAGIIFHADMLHSSAPCRPARWQVDIGKPGRAVIVERNDEPDGICSTGCVRTGRQHLMLARFHPSDGW